MDEEVRKAKGEQQRFSRGSSSLTLTQNPTLKERSSSSTSSTTSSSKAAARAASSFLALHLTCRASSATSSGLVPSLSSSVPHVRLGSLPSPSKPRPSASSTSGSSAPCTPVKSSALSPPQALSPPRLPTPPPLLLDGSAVERRPPTTSPTRPPTRPCLPLSLIWSDSSPPFPFFVFQ